MSRLLKAVGLALLVALTATPALGDWASAQSSRGVRAEPNDFWYWHRVGPTGVGKAPGALLPTDVIYDDSHIYFWPLGDNYLNMPRAWGVMQEHPLSEVIVATTDTEFLTSHFDLADNVWKNAWEDGGTAGVDDDGDGFVDVVWPPKISDYTGIRLGSTPTSAHSETASMEVSTAGGGTEQHGTNMLSMALAVTDNEPWWQGRSAADYLPELSYRRPGIPGVAWNAAKLLPAVPAHTSRRFLDYVGFMRAQGHPVRVMSCSWTGDSADYENWVKTLSAYGVLVIGGSDNISWEASGMGGWDDCLIIGGVERSTYRRARISGVEDGVSYRTNSVTGGKIDTNGYIPFGGGWFDWSGNTYLQNTGNSYYWTLGYLRTTSFSSYDDMDQGEKAVYGLPGQGTVDFSDPPVMHPIILPSDVRTSGTTTQAAGVAAILFAMYPELEPGQVAGMMRRGSVNIDALNDTECCNGATKEDCFTWVDGSNGEPLDGVLQDGGFGGPGEITGRIEGDPCAGLLGAGRLDAYRSMTLWGLVDVDTTFSGDVWVSGDVMFAGAITITVEPGTRFHIAPDDITYLDPWDPENRYDMSDLGPGDSYGYADVQTAPQGSVEFIFYDAGPTMVINGTEQDPVVFDSFVNDTQTANDWIGINIFDASSISKPNGAASLQLLHSTNGEF